jgi:hypothetical protein
MFLPRVASFVQNLMGLAAGQSLVPKVYRQSGQLAKLSGKGLCSGSLRAQVSGKMDGIANDDANHRELPRQTR